MDPFQTRIVIPLREQDDKFYQIQQLIDAKKDLLMQKQKKLQAISKQNQFLESIRSDYEKYYKYIAQQKRDQIYALQVLDEYIQDLTRTGQLTKHNIEDAKEEQLRILREVKHIKESLNDIIGDIDEH